MQNLIPVHVGLVGHIDHGKTELAKCLSDKVFTAGLDKHPQSKKRGITIDLGFSMFSSDKYLVTLVDAPGHADLIRSVVAGASIIDAAILTVAADEGVQIQTIEHATVLKAMGIDKLFVAITKTDLVKNDQVKQVLREVRGIAKRLKLEPVDYIPVSAETGAGIQKMREILLDSLTPPDREDEGPLRIPIDHAFPVTGHGTVLTGTILRGSLSTGDAVQLMPGGSRATVRTIQTFGQERDSATAGDRVGVNAPAFDHDRIERGNYLCTPDSMKTAESLLIGVELNPGYQGRITARMVVKATVGMSSVTAEIVPFRKINGRKIPLKEPEKRVFEAALLLKEKVPAEIGNRVLLMRTDMPVTSMRIVGCGIINDIVRIVTLDQVRTKHGEISRIRDENVLIEGLARTKKRAQSLKGRTVHTKNGVKGKILDSFGTRGVVVGKFDDEVRIEEEIVLEDHIEEEHRFGR
ncbi:MAG: selenocysteine-specific translation elongation factor [Candidatus Thorarchaeota archaeon]|nr:selenocysteine-specific translation elongation factor [Candidatus Thorarchaeota archaeon]